MDILKAFYEQNPEVFERVKAIEEMNKKLNRRRRLKAYRRIEEVERIKEKLYGEQK